MKTLQQMQSQLDNISEVYFNLVNDALTSNGWKAYDLDFDSEKSENAKECKIAKHHLYFAKQNYYK